MYVVQLAIFKSLQNTQFRSCTLYSQLYSNLYKIHSLDHVRCTASYIQIFTKYIVQIMYVVQLAIFKSVNNTQFRSCALYSQLYSNFYIIHSLEHVRCTASYIQICTKYIVQIMNVVQLAIFKSVNNTQFRSCTLYSQLYSNLYFTVHVASHLENRFTNCTKMLEIFQSIYLNLSLQ